MEGTTLMQALYICRITVESRENHHRARPTLAVPMALAPAYSLQDERAITAVVHGTTG